MSGSTVVLNWSAPAGAVTSYIIAVGSGPWDKDLANFDTGSPVTSLAVLNVPARIYWVHVRARNGADVSDPSNLISVTVAGAGCTAELDPPFIWHVNGSGSSVSLTWDVPLYGCRPTEYVIEAGSTRGATDLANFRTGTPVPRYDATGVAPGTYYVRVRSANEFGVSIPNFEKVIVVGGGCLYAVTSSSIFISLGGNGESIELDTGAGCVWTMTPDASWLMPPGSRLPASGQGPARVSVFTNPNLSGAWRSGTVMVRWPGGGVDVAVVQRG